MYEADLLLTESGVPEAEGTLRLGGALGVLE